MICWLIGGEDDPIDVFEIAKASTMTELRNWAARRAATDPEIGEEGFPLFVEHSVWEGEWSASEIPGLLAELEELRHLAVEQERYTPDVRWRSAVLDRCLRAARFAAAGGERITIR